MVGNDPVVLLGPNNGEDDEDDDAFLSCRLMALGGKGKGKGKRGNVEDPVSTEVDIISGDHQGGGKGVQQFSPDVPFSPTREDGLVSVGSAAVHVDEQIRAMHNKVDNVMTERCRCRTRPCRCRHTAVAGFTRDGDKKGAKYRNKLPDPDAEVNRLHISFKGLDHVNPDDLGRGKRTTKRRYQEGDADFVLDDNTHLPAPPKRRHGEQIPVRFQDKQSRRDNADLARRQRLAEVADIPESPKLGLDRLSAEEMPLDQTVQSPHRNEDPRPRHSPTLHPRNSPRAAKKEEPLINEQV